MTQTSDPLSGEFIETYKEQAPNQLGTGPIKFEAFACHLFRAEFAVVGDDLVFHFHKPEGAEHDMTPQNLENYWGRAFPISLDAVAREFFRAEYPRLAATRVEERDKKTEFEGKELPLDSWWLKACGFAIETSDPQALAKAFYRRLSTDLRSLNRT